MELAIDLDEHFVEMPPPIRKRAGSVDPLLSDLRREHRAEAIPPTAHRLMADVYAAFGEEILDVSKRT